MDGVTQKHNFDLAFSFVLNKDDKLSQRLENSIFCMDVLLSLL